MTSPLDMDLQWFAEGDNSDAAGDPSEAGTDNSGQGTGESKGFIDTLPEPLRDSKKLAEFRDIGSLAQSYLNLESKLGKQVTIPSKDDSPEVWDKFYSRTGRPKTADEYALAPFTGYKPDPVFDAAFKAQAHREGLSAKAAQSLYATVTQRLAQDEDARTAEVIRKREGALQALKATLGEQYEPSITAAQKTYASVFSPEARAVLRAAGLEDDPRIIADLVKLGALFGQDKMIPGSPPPAKTVTPYGYMNEGRKRPT